MYGGIGEVVNTPDCGSGMQGFDPLIPPHIFDIKPFKVFMNYRSNNLIGYWTFEYYGGHNEHRKVARNFNEMLF